jgi:hypothetical protein
MQLYIYAKSGHSFGLENVRRASAIYNMLKEEDPILCTADYRAATFAKAELGVNKGVGIDVIGNLPNVMERGDILIYDDSNEASATMQSHMEEFCKHIYKVGKDIPVDIVDGCFFHKTETKREKVLFFSDDDYANWFLELSEKSDDCYDIPMLWGHYFFFKNESRFKKVYKEVIEEEDYKETIQTTKYLLTSSIHSCLESLASGNCPIYFKRDDKEHIENYKLLIKYNIPTIEKENAASLDDIIKEYEEIILQYPKLNKIEKFNIGKIKTEIGDTLKLFETIQPSLEYKF